MAVCGAISAARGGEETIPPQPISSDKGAWGIVLQLEEGEWNDRPVPVPAAAAGAVGKLAELLDRDRGGMESPACGLYDAATIAADADADEEAGAIFALSPSNPTMASFLLGEFPVAPEDADACAASSTKSNLRLRAPPGWCCTTAKAGGEMCAPDPEAAWRF